MKSIKETALLASTHLIFPPPFSQFARLVGLTDDEFRPICNELIRDKQLVAVRNQWARKTDPPPTLVYQYEPYDVEEDRSPEGELKLLSGLRNQLRFDNHRLPIGRPVQTTLYVPTEETVRKLGGAMPSIEKAAHGVMVNEIIIRHIDRDVRLARGTGQAVDESGLRLKGLQSPGPRWRWRRPRCR